MAALGFDPNVFARLILEHERQKAAATSGDSGAQVGAGPYGLPSLPSLPQQDPQGSFGTLSNSNTPMGDRYAQMFNSPTLGRVMSGVDRAGTMGEDFAMAGSRKMDEGARHLAEAKDIQSALGSLAEMGQGGLEYMPGAGKLFASPGRAAGLGAAFGLAPVAATGGFSKGGTYYDDLSRIFGGDAEALTKKQRNELERKEREDEQKLKLKGEEGKQQIELEGQRTDAKIANQKKLKEAEDAERAAERAKTFAGQHPWWALGMQMGGATGGALLGRLIKGVGASKYNRAIEDLNSRWAKASDEGATALGAITGKRWNAAQNAALSRAEFHAERARRLQTELGERMGGGASKGWAPLALALSGSEFGSALPTIIDKATAGINPSVTDTAKRVGLGAAFGGATGMIASKSGLPLASPAGYGPETAALIKAVRALRRQHP